MAIPMQKHPIKLTSITPDGNIINEQFFIKSLMRYLRGAPKAPPKAIKKKLCHNGVSSIPCSTPIESLYRMRFNLLSTKEKVIK